MLGRLVARLLSLIMCARRAQRWGRAIGTAFWGCWRFLWRNKGAIGSGALNAGTVAVAVSQATVSAGASFVGLISQFLPALISFIFVAISAFKFGVFIPLVCRLRKLRLKRKATVWALSMMIFGLGGLYGSYRVYRGRIDRAEAEKTYKIINEKTISLPPFFLF